MASHLSGGKVNIALVQELARNELLKLLENVPGPKVIVWDRTLAGPVGLIAKYSLLQEREVVQIYPLRPGTLPPNKVNKIIFITRPHLHLMDMVAENVHGEVRPKSRKEGRHSPKEFHLFFMPRKSLLCEKRLKNRGVYGNFAGIEEFTCDLFPFDSDLLSMELDSAFKEYYLENDPTCLYQAAQAIMTLQGLFGVIPRISGKGPASKHVWELMTRMARERAGYDRPHPVAQSQIDHLLLLDRSVDLLSPLATQLTYEGLIDEIFGITNCTVQLPADKFAKPDDTLTDNSNEKKAFILNSEEELFAEIRDKNFNAVGPALSRKAKLISSQFEERHGDKTVQEMKQFVARLPHMLAMKNHLAIHTTIAELIKEVTDSNSFLESLQTEQEFMNGIDTDKAHPYIEDCIAQKEPLIKVLRLVCMQSVTNSGLKLKVLEHYKREIVQTYGFQHVLTLANLESAGLLRVQQSSRQYTVLRKTLRLTVEDSSEVTPTDISYVHSVYAPISVRLAQHLVRPPGWRGLQDVLGLLPGPTVDEMQTLPPGQGPRRGSISSQSSQNDNPKVVLVFFLGGCTFAEVSALRFLSQQEDSSVEFIIATTKLINGNTFIKSLMEPLGPNEDTNKS
ncbi:vacuolar protein sorting-associated protein 33A [Anabrus simplex]|uniref:vacuolar protein sorting-associated protein 33A n=1 Tax=Anabrus simplex TaxID=316456 RepID=UPI0035A2E25C